MLYSPQSSQRTPRGYFLHLPVILENIGGQEGRQLKIRKHSVLD
jgi:hypothetical protein